MRERILTKRERSELTEYLKTKKSNHFIVVLRWRAKKFLGTLKEDISLLETLIE